MKRNSTRILMGVIFLCAAVVIFGNSTNLWNIDFTGWWTLFLIVPGIAGMLDYGIEIWNTALVLVGAWLLALARGWLPEGLGGSLIWVGVFLLIGLELLFGGTRRKFRNYNSGDPSVFTNNPGNAQYSNPGQNTPPFNNDGWVNRETNETISHTSVFSNLRIANDSHAFLSAALTAVFGNVMYNLRGCVPVNGAVVDAVAIFGNVTVFVPENCRLQVKGVPIFGGCRCRVMRPNDPSLPLLTIRYTSVFGGVEIL